MRAIRDDEGFETPAGSSKKQDSSLTPRVVRVTEDGVKTRFDPQREVRCYRCPPGTPGQPVSELTLGLCEKHWAIKQEREAEAERSYLSRLRAYAASTGDATASAFADYLEEGDDASLSDPRRVAFNGDRFREWEAAQWEG